jgi:hypothetical protein
VTQFAGGWAGDGDIVLGPDMGVVPMTKRRIVSALALLVAFGSLASAETINMDGATARSDDTRPSRGMTQASVESRYGSPVSVKAPVGDPPISRWEYASFVVFFEHDKVIHAVAKR